MSGRAVTQRNDTGVPRVSAPSFTGRRRELAALSQGLSSPSAVVLVEGEAGIGKSGSFRSSSPPRPVKPVERW